MGEITPQEQAELDQLRSDQSDITDDELVELNQLRQEQGPIEDLQQPTPSLVDQENMLGKGAKFLYNMGTLYDTYMGGAGLRSTVGLASNAGKFGLTSKNAPTGEELAVSQGFSQDKSLDIPLPTTFQIAAAALGKDPGPIKISPAEAAGFVEEQVLDVGNVLPVGKVLKGAGKALGVGADFIGKTAVKGADIAISSAKKKSTAFNTVYETAKRSGKNVAQGLGNMLNPNVAPDAKIFKEIAETYDLPFMSGHEFGAQSPITNLERKQIESGALRAPFFKTKDKVTETVNKIIADAAPSGEPLTKEAAGDYLKESYDRAVDKLFSDVDITYNSVLANNPDFTLSKKAMDNIETVAKSVEKEANKMIGTRLNIPTRQGEELIKALSGLRESGGRFDTIRGSMDIIGKLAYRPSVGLLPDAPNVVELQKLYTTLKNNVALSVEDTLGAKAASQLRKNNQKIATFLTDAKPLEKTIGNPSISGEELFKKLILDANSGKLNALLKILDPQDVKELGASFLSHSLLEDPGKTLKHLGAKPHIVSRIVDKKDLEKLTNVLKYGERMGAAQFPGSSVGNLLNSVTGVIALAVTGSASLEALKTAARTKAQKEAVALLEKTPKSNWAKLLRDMPIKDPSILRVLSKAGVSIRSNEENKKRGFEALKGK